MYLLFLLLFICIGNLSSQVVGTFVSSDYSTGKLASLENFNGAPNFTSTDYSGDVSIFIHNGFVYLLEAGTPSKIHKFSSLDLENDLYKENDNNGFVLDNLVNDGLCVNSFSGADPVSIDFVSETKAYLVLYNYAKVLIVNPSATNINDFKLGELNLSSFSDDDSCPEIRAVKIFNNQAFFTLQRLDRNNSWAVNNDAKIVIVNINDDTIIDNIDTTGLRNPNSQLKVYQNKLFVSFQGPIYPVDSNYGGLIYFDTTNIYHEQLSDISVKDFAFYQNDIYLLDYNGWGDVSLKKASLDNIVGTIETAFGFTGGQNLFNLMITNNNLWLLDRTTDNGAIHKIDLNTEELVSYSLIDYPPYEIASGDNSTNISIDSDNTNILMYPNPTSTTINIRSSNIINYVSVSTIEGQVVKEYAPEKTTITINTDNLNAGIYILKVKTEQKTFTKKLVVTKR